LLWAYFINIIYGIYFYPKYAVMNYYDTGSYFDAFQRISNWRADMFRTPVYPILLVLFDPMDGSKDAFTPVLAYFQLLIFYVSMYCFYRLMKNFTKKPIIQAAAVIAYGCASPIIIFNKSLLTESLTISGIIFLMFLFFRHIETKRGGFLISACFVTFILTMLRPSNVFIYIVTGIYTAGFWVRNKRFSSPVAVYAVCLLMLFGYMWLNRIQNNYFGLSIVSERNRMHDIVCADIYHDNSDREIVKAIEAKKAEDRPDPEIAYEVGLEFESFSPINRIGAFVSEAMRKHPILFLRYLVRKSLDIGQTSMLMWYSNSQVKEGVPEPLVIPGDFLSLNIGAIFLMAIIEFLVVLSGWIREKTVQWDSFLLFLMIAGQSAMNILAAPGEYHRLFAPVYPLVILCLFSHSGWRGRLSRKQEKPEKPARNALRPVYNSGR